MSDKDNNDLNVAKIQIPILLINLKNLNKEWIMKNIAIVSGVKSRLGLELVKILNSNGYFVYIIDKD